MGISWIEVIRAVSSHQHEVSSLLSPPLWPWFTLKLTPIFWDMADTDSDTLDLDTLESDTLDLRALPVSMPLTCPCPATFTTERGRLRLSPTSDTDSDTQESDTLELDSRALPVSTLPMSPCHVLLDSDLSTPTERGKPRLNLSTGTDTLVSDMLVLDTDMNPLQ